ncbi:MAG: pyridoxamine 5'-phosphate oxidase family protein, partial [Sarcina sp.]
MITKTNFIEIMNSQTEMALATTANNIPNVRIINFYFDTNTNTIFFTSFKKNKKIKEFEINPNIGFTTIPKNGVEHVKGNG